MAKMNKVCVNTDQSDANNGGFSDNEKAQARKNIGAASKLSVDEALQDLSMTVGNHSQAINAIRGILTPKSATGSGTFIAGQGHVTISLDSPLDLLIGNVCIAYLQNSTGSPRVELLDSDGSLIESYSIAGIATEYVGAEQSNHFVSGIADLAAVKIYYGSYVEMNTTVNVSVRGI
ncbi:MAG: hypothetical protein J6W22_05920 [Fibrobacter sp.]|nr:hypothetical protein [Fibrobacter sp.]